MVDDETCKEEYLARPFLCFGTDHVLQPLLPPPVVQNYNLRSRSHDRQLPERTSRLIDCNFIIRMLYHHMY